MSQIAYPVRTAGAVYGKHTCSVSLTQAISIPGLTASTGAIMAFYLHDGASGAGQFLRSIVYTAGTATITLGSTGAVADSIIWYLLSY
jgi:hypothetical protein